jgi:hypothetical protein
MLSNPLDGCYKANCETPLLTRNIETAMNELPLFLSRFLARPKRI